MKGCRDGSAVKIMLLFHRTQDLFPTPIPGSSQLPVTPALWNMKASSGLHEHLRTRGKHAETARKRQIQTNVHTYKSFVKTERERGKISVKNSR